MKKQKIYNALEWLGFVICLFGIYLSGHTNTDNSEMLIFIGAIITLVFYFIKKWKMINLRKR